MEPASPIFDPDRRRFIHRNAIWVTISLVFLAGFAFLPPQLETHKLFILLAIGIVELLEARIVVRFPKRGVSYVLLLKILLATVLIDHTGEVRINNSYYPIYCLPVLTAACYCGPWITLLWTLFASAAYGSYLYPVTQEYKLTPEAFGYFAAQVMFFFLAAIFVNRFLRFQTLPEHRSSRHSLDEL